MDWAVALELKRRAFVLSVVGAMSLVSPVLVGLALLALVAPLKLFTLARFILAGARAFTFGFLMEIVLIGNLFRPI